MRVPSDNRVSHDARRDGPSHEVRPIGLARLGLTPWTIKVPNLKPSPCWLSQLGQHARQDFEPQVFFIAQSICATLDDADLVVQPFDEPEGYLVFQLTVGRDA